MHIFTFKESHPGIDYLSIILGETMTTMLKSAQMLCGSFVSDDMTEVEKQERIVMNQMRFQEMIKDWCEEGLAGVVSCEMWVKMVVGKMVVQEVVREVVEELGAW